VVVLFICVGILLDQIPTPDSPWFGELTLGKCLDACLAGLVSLRIAKNIPAEWFDIVQLSNIWSERYYKPSPVDIMAVPTPT
jgi:hypothetical protein